jgi:replicative DNA helicase
MDNLNEIKNELELQILSVMINDPKSIPSIIQKVNAEDFSKDNKELFIKISELSHIIDSINLILQLSKSNIKNWKYKELENLYAKGMSLERLYKYQVIEQFKDLAINQKLTLLCEKQIKELKTDSNGLDKAIELKSEVEAILKGIENIKEEKPYSETLPLIIESIEREIHSPSANSLTLTNLPSFNNATGGMKLSNLIGIGGAYKSGKTTLGINIVLNLVIQGIPCGFFSLELSEDELNRKILGMLSRVEYEYLRDPKKLDENSKTKISKIYHNISNLPLYISDKLLSENELKAKAKLWKERFGVNVICIDYLGYMRSNKKFDTREREMSYYSGFLKQLAKELNIVVIVLAQLNRKGKQEPTTENLAESIALARDCDFLFITYNPLEMGIKKDKNIVFNESHFITKLDTTRHTRFKKQFLLYMNNDGNFIEIATEYDNDYMNVLPEEELTIF